LPDKASLDLGGVRVYGLFRPYVGLGLSGKFDYETIVGLSENSFVIDVMWVADRDFKRLDYGLTEGAGVEVRSVLIGLTNHLGLANIAAEKGQDARANHRVLAVSTRYIFGR